MLCVAIAILLPTRHICVINTCPSTTVHVYVYVMMVENFVNFGNHKNIICEILIIKAWHEEMHKMAPLLETLIKKLVTLI